ncbi:ribose ABC transporter permease [Haladaptatus sp. R4]|uniref:ABC transporter permease n=1 Tax=Haladaptatus sp. R4 TaxID=1679489 RepID=UPI0007B476FE|nr:ABC transporter permease [Haladaptatus sp. R4]KZN22966.1 ribose ABC transporter permease [Haladaptatus sp. R4]
MNRRVRLTIWSVVIAAIIGVVGFLFPNSVVGKIVGTINGSYASAALRATVPIGFAALGGIFAEKSGVINIGLEGHLIISAFTGVAVANALAGPAGATQTTLWLGFFAAVIASGLLALLFAVVCIEFKADQIIAGLAVWLIALGLAPFASKILWGGINSPSVGTITNWRIPLLAKIPVIGPVLFNANPTVYMLLIAVPLTWGVLNKTAFGQWVKASGENPMALDTVGINVHRVRYASVLISGLLAGIGGAGLSLGQAGLFNGSGTTMVNGRGWIGITAYLFGNYNPFGAFGASFLFASLDALQLRLQQVGFNVPRELIGIIPYVTVIIVLVFVGHTRTPDAAGEPYESGEE